MTYKKINNVILTVIYTLLLHFSSYAGAVNDGNNYILGRNLIIVVMIIYLSFVNNRIPYLINNKYYNIWYLFSLVVAISVFPTNFSEGIKLLCVPVIYFIIMQYDSMILMNFSMAMVINGIWILVHSIQMRGIYIELYYRGIFSNSNTFGATMASFFVGACCMFLYSKTAKGRVLSTVLALAAFLFQSLSFCRAALLTSVVVFTIVFFSVAKRHKNTKKLIMGYVAILLSLAMFIAFKGNEILSFISSHVWKWSGESGGDLSSSRVDRWLEVLKNPTWFGTEVEMHPHNNFIFVLYAYGIIAGLLFAGLVFYVLFKYIYVNKMLDNIEKYIVYIYIVTFISIGMFEESLGFTGREWMVIGFVGLGYAMNKLKQAKQKSRISKINKG